MNRPDTARPVRRRLRWRLRRRFATTAALLLLATGLAAPAATASPDTAERQATYQNPIRPGADPWMTYYDGNYYLAATTATTQVTVAKSPTVTTLGDVDAQVVFDTRDAPSEHKNQVWAPEFHQIGEKWYLYYTAQIGGDISSHRLFVAESEGSDPMGPYTYKGQLQTLDFFSIDGTILDVGDRSYFVYAGVPTQGKQKLYIAPMSNPWTLSDTPKILSEPTQEWEMIGNGETQEGAYPLYRNGKIYLVFSAAQCATPDYAVGLLTYQGGDPTDRNAWTKSDGPVFSKNPEAGIYGPGHNSFFTSPDGSQTWIAYHARDYEDSQSCGEPRALRIQKIGWNDDDTPDFGRPVPDNTDLPVPAGDPGN